jgi:hypothetical protein
MCYKSIKTFIAVIKESNLAIIFQHTIKGWFSFPPLYVILLLCEFETHNNTIQDISSRSIYLFTKRR